MAGTRIHRRDFMRTAAFCGAGLGVAGAAGAQDTPADAAPAPDAAAGAAQMPRRELGKTGVQIPILVMGGSQRFDLKYDKMLHRAFNMGIDYIDTAQSYAGGESQKGVAVFHQQVGRDKVWITTKAALNGSKMTPDNYKTQLDDCLESLQTDYVNLFFMHMIQSEDNLGPDFLKMGDDLKKSGKTKFFGFSCHHGNVPQLLQKAAQTGGIDAIMFRFNFRQYGDVELNNAIDACKKAGIGLIAMKTQASVPEDEERVVEFQSKDFTLPQAKLKSVWADDRIDAAISQMSNVQMVQENVAAAASPVQLTLNEFNQLNRLARLTRSSACLGCNHLCETKIGGKLRIADALRYLMYAESYHDPETARLLYHALAPEEREYDGLDFTEANRACPQGIQIEQRLKKAREVLVS